MRKKPFLKVAIMLTLSLLIIVSSMFSSISPLLTENNRALAADGTEQVEPNDSGGVINPQNPQEFEDSIISKKATYTGTPGEYFIDLKVQGKEKVIKEPTDIVIVYDNSNSMETNDRVAIAKEAVTNFINHTLTPENDNIRMALVTFGTNVLDGRVNEVYNVGPTGNYSYKTLTTDATALKNKIPTNIPSDRRRSYDGGTNIQQGLQVAKEILNKSNAEHKIIVTVTDGAPTVSYENKVRKGNGTSFTYEREKNHGTNTIAEARGIQSNGIDMYTIGIELSADAGATEEQVTYVMQNIASSPEQYYNADKANELVDILTGLAKGITGTINNGEVTDPMSEYVDLALTDGEFKRASDDQLTDGSYYLSAADPKFLTGVTVGYKNNTITLGSLMLGKDQYINIRYKVNINTDKESFNGTDYFPTNGTTTLIPNTKDPDSPTREFIVPKVQGKTLDISGTKIWEDKGGESNRPSEIELELYRTTGDRSNGTLVDTVTVTPDSNDKWKYDFGMKPVYSSIGEMYDYYIKEITVDGYTTTYNKETFDVTNTLIDEPKIELTKTSDDKEVTEAGQVVTYNFKVTNNGNVTLKNIVLDDPMLGGNVELEKTTLAPGESITVSKKYTVTQADIDNGNVHNIATVKGEDPKGETPEDEDEVEVPVTQTPSIDLVKIADRTDLVVGEDINYTFTATNTGNVTLNKVNLVDELEGISDITYVSVNGEAIEDIKAITLKPGDVLVANASYTVTQDDVDTGIVENNATVFGTPSNSEEPISDTDSVSVPQDVQGNLTLEKSTKTESYAEVGQTIVYNFVITNNSNVTMKDIKLNDPMLGGDIELENTMLNPGKSITVSKEYTVTQDDLDNGEIKNVATVTGEDPRGNTSTDEDDVTVVGTQDSQLALEKTSDDKEVTEAGQVVTYNFKVTNNGNVTIKNIVLDDPMLGGTIELDKTTLAPGESITVSKEYTVTQADIDNGNIHNIATVKGEDPKGETPEDEDEVEVPVTQTPSIDLVKIADRTDLVVGEDINYTFTATNTGNVTLNKLNLVDELKGISDITYVSVNGEEIEDIEAITLKPGDVLLANASYTVTQDDVDAGIVENKATVFGTPANSEEPISDTDKVSVPQDVQGNLTLEKSSDTTEFTEAGQTIVYNFVITNNSNVTMKDIKLNDPMLGGDIELENTMLNPGKSITVSKEYTVTQDDLDNGEIKNIATVTGEDPRGNTSTDEDDVTVVGTQNSQLALEKTSDTKEVTEAGQVVTYNFKVTNNGNVTIKNIVLDDPMLGGTIELDKTTLAPGESITVSKEYTVTQEDLNNGEIINVATVTGETPGGETPEDEDEVTIPSINSPNITLKKESDVKEVEKVGDVVNYTFTITNNGNVDLHRVILNDPMLGGNIELESTDLKVGESIKVSVQHKVTEEQLKYATITNKAIASGLSPKNELVYDVDDVVINTALPVVEPKPEGEITKEVNGKGGYRVAENGETFAFDIKALLKEGQDIETLTILDEIDERLEIESVDVTIDEDTVIESSADDIKKLNSEKAELESNLTVLESELEALEATLAQTKEKEAEEVIEEPEVVEPTEDETTEEPEVTEPVEEEEVTEPVEEQQEPATEESEEASEPKGAKPVNTEAIETAIEELKVQINELKAEIEDIDVQISELEANNIDLKAGSILEHGELVQNGQTVEFKVTNKEVLKALEGQTIKMTIKAKFKTIDDDALANGVENTATVTFGDKPKDTNTVVVYPIKKEEPTPEEPEIPEEPEEPVKPTPEPEEPEVPEKPESTPPPTKEVPNVTPPVEKAPETPAQSKVEEKEKLPKTGEAHNRNYAGVIALALAGTFMLLISRRKKSER